MNNHLEENEIAEDVVYSIAAYESENTKPKVTLCCAATSQGLIFTKNGATWENAYLSLNIEEALTTTSVVISPNFSSDHTIISGVSGGVLRSEDGGKSWQTILFPPPLPVISCLAISPDFQHDGIVVAGTMEDGVYFSSDEGVHWVTWNFGLLDLNILCLAISPSFAKDETIFAGTESGIFKSTNGGRAWREIVLPIGYAPIISLCVSPNFEKDQTIVAGTEDNGMFLTTNGGKNWVQISAIATEDPINQILMINSPDNIPNLLAIVGGKLLHSRDHGSTWQEVLLDTDQEITAIAMLENRTIWCGVVGARVIKNQID